MDRLFIQVSGPEGSGKGNLIAFLYHKLFESGIACQVQLGDSHNKSKLERPDAALLDRLAQCDIIITEMQTSGIRLTQTG